MALRSSLALAQVSGPTLTVRQLTSKNRIQLASVLMPLTFLRSLGGMRTHIPHSLLGSPINPCLID